MAKTKGPYSKKISTNNGNTYTGAESADLNNWASIVEAMDGNARESVHAELAPCGEREFLTAYLERAPHDLVIG